MMLATTPSDADLAELEVLLPSRAVATEDPVVTERLGQWRADYLPATPREEWLYKQLVVASVRIDASRIEELDARRTRARRAVICWDDDRRRQAEELGARLAQKPALVLCQLLRTKQGCEWLIARWKRLAEVVEPGGEWNEAQHALAFDLLGLDRANRPRMPHWKGPEVELVLARSEIVRLERLVVDKLSDLDAAEKSAAARGLEIEANAETKRRRRYEAECFRRMHWAEKQLRDSQEKTAVETPAEPPAPPVAPVPSPYFRSSPEEFDAMVKRVNEQRTSEAKNVLPSLPPAPLIPQDQGPVHAGNGVKPPVLSNPSLPRPNRRARRAAQRLAASSSR